MQQTFAHISDSAAAFNSWWLAGAVVIMVGLVVEHHLVAGFQAATIRRRAQAVVAVLAAAAVSAAVTPVGITASAQSDTRELPDLISDPPRPSFFTELTTADGDTRLVVTFDGYVHNIGEGALDVVGNPQQVDGMRQRVRNGDDWEDVGSPTVRFETDDGHNHFHLIEAIEYVLWNELQGAQTAIGSKVGFCLVDSEQIEPGTDQAYSEEADNFCEEDNPGATSLRMGISPGWRDIYDATTTLQWVDVSQVVPGRYWIGAITDPNDEILESDESNNGLIFSERTIAVPGFSPRSQPALVVDGPVVEFSLDSTAHGTVTRPVFVIEQGPQSGSLDVPVGSDLGSPTVRYFPDPGFEGTDEIVFSVRDAASPYPFVAPQQTISFDVGSSTGDTNDPPDADRSLAPSLNAPSTFFESEVGQASTVDIQAIDVQGEAARLFATGLPTGLVADADTGTISGVAIEDGIFEVTLIAIGATPAEIATSEVTWIINPSSSAGGLRDVVDQSSPRGELTRLRVGTNVLGLRFEADGLPPGLDVDPTSPLIAGTPTEAGVYDVTIRQIDVDQVVTEVDFTWTIRPTTDIEFAL